MNLDNRSLSSSVPSRSKESDILHLPEPHFADEIIVEPLWRSLVSGIRETFSPRKLPPLNLSSAPVAVEDPFAVRPDPFSSGFSLAVHLVLLALIGWFFYMAHLHINPIKQTKTVTTFDVSPYLPIAPSAQKMGGGGGGGSHDILQTPKGRLPKFEKNPIVPPMVIENPKPKLAIEPAIKMPENIQQPQSALPDLGNPKSTVVGPQSNGTGSSSGMGTGRNGGSGYGPGGNGGTGGGTFQVGGGVSTPVLIYSVDPEFSDEARREKYQGISTLAVIVDAQGNVQNPRVVQALGMGLDERAIQAVKLYRFRPAQLQGKPVPVRIWVQVIFRIY